MSDLEEGSGQGEKDVPEFIVFMVGNSREEFVVNRELFLNASPKFLQLLLDNSENETIQLRNVEAFTFQQILNFVCMGPQWIYDRGVIQNAPELLRTAKFFQLKELIHTCSDFLASSPNCWELNSVMSLLNDLIEIGEDAVGAKNSALEFIAVNISKLLQTHDFKLLSPEALCEILCRDDLNLQMEIRLFEAVLRWGQFYCGSHSEENHQSLREILAAPLRLIRFHQMSRQEFEQIVQPTQLLSPEEELTIQSFWSNPDSRSDNQIFKSSPRKYLREKPSLYVIPEEEEDDDAKKDF